MLCRLEAMQFLLACFCLVQTYLRLCREVTPVNFTSELWSALRGNLTDVADWIADQNRLGGSTSKGGLKRKVNRKGNINTAYFVMVDLEEEAKAVADAEAAAAARAAARLEVCVLIGDSSSIVVTANLRVFSVCQAAKLEEAVEKYGSHLQKGPVRTISPVATGDRLKQLAKINQAAASSTEGLNSKPVFEKARPVAEVRICVLHIVVIVLCIYLLAHRFHPML